ncbi:delta-60 repeat domain-containing protein [Corallococcus sp. EGB]|uniref:delta-60 repeat domain-containing protein n=1 Tax=Corallococcus sp. EGB TaxID=1521117 RepID=UPI001CBBEBAB|nr:delta-60 repeat domain-containing protein [Corallococcus sp. EGB]
MGPPPTPTRDAGVDAGTADSGVDGGADAGAGEQDGGSEPLPDAGGPPPAFTLSTIPEQTVRFDPSTRYAYAVDVTRAPAFTGEVALSVEGLPPHVRTTQALPVVIPEGESTTPLGYVPDEFAAYGQFSLKLVGVGGGERVEFPLTLKVEPAPAALDSAFGTEGMASPVLGVSVVKINAMAVQADGKWILVGSTGYTGARDVLVARLLPDGTPDATFGTRGVVVTDICGGDDYVDAVTLQADGRIVVAGGAISGTNTCAGTKYQSVLLARYTPAGVLDTTFGGTGMRTFQISTGISTLHAVTLDASERIIGAGTVDNSGLDLLVIRLTPLGALDTTFSGDGVATADEGRQDDGLCVVAEPDGKIVVAGTSTGSLDNLVVRRFTATGTLDSTFRYNSYSTSPTITPRTLIRLSNGKWLVGGRAVFSDGTSRAMVARLGASAGQDTSFGDDGFVFFTAALPSAKEAVVGMDLLADGTVVAATWSQDPKGASGLGVVHVDANGAKVLRAHRTDLPGEEQPTAAKLDAQGFLRVVGTRVPAGQSEAVPFVTRFHPY